MPESDRELIPKEGLDVPSIHKNLRWVVAAAAIGALIGCASIAPPIETISAADLAVTEVSRADEREISRLEIHLANEELKAARAALAKDENLAAQRHAERALVQAQLADAKIHAARANASVTQLRDDINALQLEIERASNRGRTPVTR